MKMLIIAWKDFKIRLKDKKGFLLMILMPIILTAILGAALSGVMSGVTNLPMTNVGIYVDGKDSLVDTFIKDVLDSDDLQEFIMVHEFQDENKLVQELKDETVDIALIFPNGWSDHVQRAELKRVKIYVDPGKEIKTSLVTSILDSFVSRVKAVSITTNTVLANLGDQLPDNNSPKLMKIVDEITASATEESTTINSQTVGDKPITSMQYYAVAMGVMFLLFNMMVGAKSILNERENETLARLMCTPTGKLTILFGKFLGTLYFSIAQFIVFWAATTILFSVSWGDNLLQVFVMGIVFAISVSGISMLLASIVSEEKTADLIGNIAVQILAILGGSMMPIMVFPETLKMIANFVPNKWALTSFLDIMQGVAWGELTQAIMILLMLGIGSVVVGTLRLRVR